MRRNCIFSGQWFVTALLLTISLSVYGCKDTVSVSEDVAAPLSSLTITPGTLQPDFFANTTTYAVNAPTSATSVTVAAAPKDNTATVTIDGVVTTQRSVPLGGPGSTKAILIVVETQTGLETTYTVTITRLLSSDNNLSALSAKVGTALQPLSPVFASDHLTYTVDVATNVTSVIISATKSDPSASMLIGSVTVPVGTASGQANIQLGEPGTGSPVTIEVTAPNGSKKTYQLSIKRLSGDNNLSTLSVPSHTLAPAFAANTALYDVNVATHVDSIIVSATKSDANAVMQVHSVTVPAGTASGQDTVQLNGPGVDTSVSVIVTAQNGVDRKTYTIRVHRAAPSSNNNLATLTVTPGSLAPPFAPDVVNYGVDVATNDNRVTVTATLQDTTATMLINGQGTSSGQPREVSPLQPPGSDTIIPILVRAQNGVEKPYTVTVKRPLPSSNANLSNLSVVPGGLDQPFAATIFAYTVIGVPTGNTIVFVTATKSDPNATMSSLGSVIAPPGDPDGVVPVPIGSTVEITVIAQNTVHSNTYTITFTPPLPSP